MENNDLENLIKKDDAFDTQKLLEDVDLSNVMTDIDLEEILAEYGHHKSAPLPESDESWINEGYVPKPVQSKGNIKPVQPAEQESVPEQAAEAAETA